MSNINAPRGFKSSKSAGSAYYNGADNGYRIASAYGTNIFSGDPVKLVAGKIQKAGATDQIRGVLVAVTAVSSATPAANPFMNFWAAGFAAQNGADSVALVADDPNIIWEATFTNSTSVPSYADIGSYFNQYDTGGNTASGLSGMGMDYSTKSPTSAGFVWKLVDFVTRPNNDLTSAYSRGLFKAVLHDGLVSNAT